MEERWSLRKVWKVRLSGLAALGLITLFAVRGGAATPVITIGPDSPTGAAVTLAWDPSPDPAVSGYRVYEGTSSRNYSVVYQAGNSTTLMIPGLQAGTVYFFAATAYDTNGLESDFSAELVYTNGLLAATSAPRITDVVRTAGGNYSVSGSAPPGQVCVLMAATNLVPPVSWTPLATNVVDAQGNVSLTDLYSTNYPQRFYRLWQAATP